MLAERIVGLGWWLRLAVDRCWVGGVELPRRFLASFCRTAVARLGRDRCSKPFLDATREMVVGPGRVSVTYGPVSLPPDLRREILGATVAGRDVIAATRAQIDHLLAVVGRVPRTEVSFGLCLETAFTFARDRARGKDPIPENRAALFALGGLLGHPRIEDFLGLDFDADAAAARRCGLTRVTLHGRSDWTRHFFVSAALVIFSDEVMSGAAGLLKEELDADAGGSGFSFADLLADRAGVAFAVCATRDQASARALQDRLAGGFRVDDFFPPAADLPEGIPDAQLQSQYGGVGGELYRRWVEEIEHRVAACPAYR